MSGRRAGYGFSAMTNTRTDDVDEPRADFELARQAARSRRGFLTALGLGGLSAGAVAAAGGATGEPEDFAASGRLLDLPLTESEGKKVEQGLAQQRRTLQAIRNAVLNWDEHVAFVFDPAVLANRQQHTGIERSIALAEQPTSPPFAPPLADDPDAVATKSIRELAAALRRGELTSRELTQRCIDGLRKHDAALHCVVTLLEDQALAAADRADRELASGRDRGLLHGIPYGAKDLFAWPGAPTTFGAQPLREQDLGDAKATVLKRLEDAGAVLVAKLSLGALAMGDRWFGGQTLNPWNTTRGSSGSSAGSAASVAAGLLPFALGTETNGSIVSPAVRCGVTAIRPTFGQISRAGAMPLSWSMDKVGVLGRYADDLLIVHATIAGSDIADPCTRRWAEGRVPVADETFEDLMLFGRRIGRLAGGWTDEHAEFEFWLRSRGAVVEQVEPDTTYVRELLHCVLQAEASSACDGLLRAGRLDELTNQSQFSWPRLLRTVRVLPAADYLTAMRIRRQLALEVERLLAPYDFVIGAGRGQKLLSLTNLTGQPAMTIPVAPGTDGRDSPPTVTMYANIDDDAKLYRAARAWQAQSSVHRQRPSQFV